MLSKQQLSNWLKTEADLLFFCHQVKVEIEKKTKLPQAIRESFPTWRKMLFFSSCSPTTYTDSRRATVFIKEKKTSKILHAMPFFWFIKTWNSFNLLYFCLRGRIQMFWGERSMPLSWHFFKLSKTSHILRTLFFPHQYIFEFYNGIAWVATAGFFVNVEMG